MISILCRRRPGVVDICTDCRDGGDDLAELQLVEDGGLASSVQADHQNTHLLLAPEAIEELRECETHLDNRVSPFNERGKGSVVVEIEEGSTKKVCLEAAHSKSLAQVQSERRSPIPLPRSSMMQVQIYGMRNSSALAHFTAVLSFASEAFRR